MKKGTAQMESAKPAKKKSAAKPKKTLAVPHITEYELPDGHVLCLRSNNVSNQSYGNFQWPESGECIAPDWSNKKVCGQGLHGMLWGMGEAILLNWEPDAKWLVVEVLTESIVDLKGKVKFPRGRVIFCGDRPGATNLTTKFAPVGTLVIGGTATAGYSGTATAGYSGTATAGGSGILNLSWWDSKANRRRIVTKYVGEDGIKPNVPYTIDDAGNISEVPS